jgi:hypothetical protein
MEFLICHTSLSLHISAIYGHHQVHVYIAKDIPLHIKIARTYHRLLKSKDIPVTGHGGLYGCEMLKIPPCLGDQLTDGSKVVDLIHWPLIAPRATIFLLLVLISVRGRVNPRA